MTAVRTPTAGQVDAFWADFEQATGLGAGRRPADVFAFGDSAEMADELVALVLSGVKRATAGSAAEYDAEGWRPQPGDLSVVHRGDGTPVAVLRTIEVTIGPLTGVTDAFAWEEGEGDRTRVDWIRAHQAYFRRSCARSGLPYDDDLEVVFERFEIVWAPAGGPAG